MVSKWGLAPLDSLSTSFKMRYNKLNLVKNWENVGNFSEKSSYLENSVFMCSRRKQRPTGLKSPSRCTPKLPLGIRILYERLTIPHCLLWQFWLTFGPWSDSKAPVISLSVQTNRGSGRQSGNSSKITYIDMGQPIRTAWDEKVACNMSNMDTRSVFARSRPFWTMM